MYRWQTLTLARIEANTATFGTTTEQIQAAKRLLLEIGIHYFPEPHIGYAAPPAGYHGGKHDLSLIWAVDDRQMQATIDPSAMMVGLVVTSHGKPSVAYELTLSGVREAVQELLFGPQPAAV